MVAKVPALRVMAHTIGIKEISSRGVAPGYINFAPVGAFPGALPLAVPVYTTKMLAREIAPNGTHDRN